MRVLERDRGPAVHPATKLPVPVPVTPRALPLPIAPVAVVDDLLRPSLCRKERRSRLAMGRPRRAYSPCRAWPEARLRRTAPEAACRACDILCWSRICLANHPRLDTRCRRLSPPGRDPTSDSGASSSRAVFDSSPLPPPPGSGLFRFRHANRSVAESWLLIASRDVAAERRLTPRARPV